MYLYDELKELEKEGPIRIGLVGAGFMGKGVVEVLHESPGMEVIAIADVDLSRAAQAFDHIGVSSYREITRIEETKQIDISRKRIITSNHRLIPRIQEVDMVIEATGVTEIGAEVAFDGIMNGKHIGMMNVETDVTVGYYLASLARSAGVVYTVCTGDEPAAIKELYDFFASLGFSIVSCGKGKNNPLDRHATPNTLSETAAQKGLNPRILTEFVDGSKTMVEMSAVANATGLGIDTRNMHGPHVNIDKIHQVLCTREDGGILTSPGVVDYVIGDLAPGVFVVVRHPGRITNETLHYLKLGDGPNYLFYRPYHLTSIEVPISITLAILYQKASLATTRPPTTEVITFAKRPLKPGDTIDSIGGYTVYGGIERAEVAQQQHLLPLGLCEGAEILEEIPIDTPLTYNQVRLKDSFLLNLRHIQDRLND